MGYHPPKAIVRHPGVETCESGPASGIDYRHEVILRSGWVFRRGRMAGCVTGHFNNVADFKHAEPTRREEVRDGE